MFGLRDKKKELEELMNYQIEDEVIIYSTKPGLTDVDNNKGLQVKT